MRPADIQAIGKELAIKWEDGRESFIRLDVLRRHCPCAACKGETDILGQVHRGPERVLNESSYCLARLGWVGGYALQPFWGDGHSSGLYSYDYLERIAGLSASDRGQGSM